MIKILSLFLIASLLTGTAAAAADTTLVIAHRGASGYLPEHTLEAKALAYGMRPDYIEQDLVLSKDDQLIVMHDIYLDSTTNVAEVFPERAREDGHYYTIDFTLNELKQLQVSEAFVDAGSGKKQKYPGRFPLEKSSFQLSTFAEEIELIQGLNQSLGYNIGIYPEIKKPAFHHREGRDIAALALRTLKRYGYTGREQKVFLQCFDAEELQRIDRHLMPKLRMDLPLVQLIAMTSWGEKRIESHGQLIHYDYSWMLEPGGLEKISDYADAIGPWAMMLVEQKNETISPTGLLSRAQQMELDVHPYTFRADQVPEQIGSFSALLELFVDRLGVDGLFTDHPDRVRAFITETTQSN